MAGNDAFETAATVSRYLAPLVAIAGAWLAVRGGVRTTRALRLPSDTPGKNLALMSGFRFVLTGLALAGVALGWLFSIEALMVAAAIIGLGELAETSVDVWALRRELEETGRDGTGARLTP